MATIDLPAGPIDLIDTGGDGPVVVLVHGLLMDGEMWREVTADLRADHRVVAPTLPLGAHRTPMHPGADLSMTGQADLLAEVLDRLDADDVTLVANDWGGPLITAARHPHLIDRLVVTPCEALDNLPPGLPGRVADVSGRMPGGLFLAAQSLRVRALQRLPLTFGPHGRGRPAPGPGAAVAATPAQAARRPARPRCVRAYDARRRARGDRRRPGGARRGHPRGLDHRRAHDARRARPAPGRAGAARPLRRDRRRPRAGAARPAGHGGPAGARVHPQPPARRRHRRGGGCRRRAGGAAPAAKATA